MRNCLMFLAIFTTFALHGADNVSTPDLPLKDEEAANELSKNFKDMKSLWELNKTKDKEYWNRYPSFVSFYSITFRHLLNSDYLENEKFVDDLRIEDKELSFLFPLIKEPDARDLLKKNKTMLELLLNFLLELHFKRPLVKFEKEMIQTIYSKDLNEFAAIIQEMACKKVGENRDPGHKLRKEYAYEFQNLFKTLLNEMIPSINASIQNICLPIENNKGASLQFKFKPFAL